MTETAAGGSTTGSGEPPITNGTPAGGDLRIAGPFGVMIGSFVLLGAPIAALGVAWPSMAADFDRSLGSLGVLSVSFGVGYAASTVAAGSVAHLLSVERRLAIATILAVGSLLGFATTSSWSGLVVAAIALGVAGGQIDAAVNAHVALHDDVSAMGYIHGSFGIGVALAPLLIVGLAALGASWRVGFAVLAAAQCVIAVAFIVLARHARSRSPIAESVRPRWSPLGRRLMIVSILAFGAYGGLAAGTGQWAYTVLTQDLGVADGVAGVAVAGYWAGFTSSRLMLGLAGRRFDIQQIPGVATAVTLLCLVIFWIGPGSPIAVAGLVVSGFAHGPFFPVQTLFAPRRFGAALAPAAVGYQIAAANLGAAVVPGVIGVAVEAFGLGSVRPMLVATAVVVVVLTEALRRASPVATVGTARAK